MSKTNCPCGRHKTYENCCGKIHSNSSAAQTAEDLMRSRYTAFVMGNGKYLQKSHHPTTRPTKQEAKEIEKWAKAVSWLRLELLESWKGTENDLEGTVTFKAFFMDGLQVDVIQERSLFVKNNGI